MRLDHRRRPGAHQSGLSSWSHGAGAWAGVRGEGRWHALHGGRARRARALPPRLKAGVVDLVAAPELLELGGAEEGEAGVARHLLHALAEGACLDAGGRGEARLAALEAVEAAAEEAEQQVEVVGEEAACA